MTVQQLTEGFADLSSFRAEPPPGSRFKNRLRWNEEKEAGDVRRRRQLEEESWRAGRETLGAERHTQAGGRDTKLKN